VKKIFYIFILWLIPGSITLVENSSTSILTNSSSKTQRHNNEIVKEKISCDLLKDSNSKHSKEPVKVKKRKKAKGTQIAGYLVDKYISDINVFEKDSTVLIQNFYFTRLLYSNEKRGPPFAFLFS